MPPLPAAQRPGHGEEGLSQYSGSRSGRRYPRTATADAAATAINADDGKS